nr:MAG TPA: hypothetical protein [Caudoviricetes sp.]
MKKVKLIFFEPDQQAVHEGVTYVAKLQMPNRLCEGCAFNKRGEPCECPRGWVCIGLTDSSNIIFNKK